MRSRNNHQYFMGMAGFIGNLIVTQLTLEFDTVCQIKSLFQQRQKCSYSMIKREPTISLMRHVCRVVSAATLSASSASHSAPR